MRCSRSDLYGLQLFACCIEAHIVPASCSWHLRYQTTARKSSQAISDNRTVPLAAAQLLSRRWIGIVEVPSEVERALERNTEGVIGGEGRHLTAAARRLVSLLRNNSRTSKRGGGHARVEMDAASGMRKRAEKRKGGRSHSQMLREMQFGQGALIPDDVWDKKPSKEDAEFFAETERAAVEEAASTETSGKAPIYSPAETAAYAAARLPATYAVLFKVMSELQIRLPDFRPQKMLDFGAGPGTAIWAASAVWGGDALKPVHAVEKSLEMMALGYQCQGALREADPSVPSVQWSRKLSRSVQGHSFVVASYVLAELRTPAERRKTVEALWARTTGVLLLVEPGTPVGSANIREARTQILATVKSTEPLTEGTLTGETDQAAERIGIGTGCAARQAGAHVVAPCPHDGGCPMDGTDSWCHFAQRFRRTVAQKRSKTLEGGQKPRDYQDERFSYVALRRGPRPAAVGTHITKGSAAAAMEAANVTMPVDAAGLASTGSDEEEISEAEEEPMEPPSEEALALIMQSIRDENSDDDEDSDEEATDRAAFLEEVAKHSMQSRAPPVPAIAVPSAVTDTPNSAQTTDIVQGGGDPPQIVTFISDTAAFTGGQSVEESDEEEEEENDGEPPPLSPRDIEAAVAASGSWSRVIRPPRKKRGHVVLDLCSANGPGGKGPPQLQKQFLSKGSIRDAALYRVLRKLRWGDLWPHRRS